MRYRVIISGEIDIEANSKEEAENKVVINLDKQFMLENKSSTSILEFDAILDDIQDEDQKYYKNETKAIKEGEEYIKEQQEIKMNNLLSDI